MLLKIVNIIENENLIYFWDKISKLNIKESIRNWVFVFFRCFFV